MHLRWAEANPCSGCPWSRRHTAPQAAWGEQWEGSALYSPQESPKDVARVVWIVCGPFSVLLWGRAAVFIYTLLSTSCCAVTSQATLWERFLYGEWRGISCHFLKFLPAAYQHWAGLIWVELQPARANPGSYFRGAEWQLWRCHFSACDPGY